MAVRRVRRVIRKIDPWTVLKASLVFNAIVGLVFVLGTWVMWSIVLQRGIPDRIVELFESLTLTITIDGALYFRIVALLTVIGVVVMTGFMTLAAIVYNLISDMVGGIEVTVLEETFNVAAAAPAVAARVRPALHRAPQATGVATQQQEAAASRAAAASQAADGD